MTKYKTLEEWLEELAKRESNGNYSAVNPFGYLGKYQMGEGALTDVGYYNGRSPGNHQEWRGKFLGKDGVFSKEDFLNNPHAQENAIKDYVKKQWQYLKSEKSHNYVGTKINDIDITPSGLLAGAHLTGYVQAGKYLRSNGKYIPKDGNGVSIEEYIKNFGGYDVAEIIDPNYYSPRFPQTKEEKVDQILNKTSNVIQDITKKVDPPTQTIPDNVINETPIQPPLSDEEWRKRLKRKRMGLW